MSSESFQFGQKRQIAAELSQYKLPEISLEESLSLHILRGLAIIGVVYVHVTPHPNILLTFGMPLFFFVGGYLTRPRADLRVYTVGKFQQLMVPYLVFLTLFSIPSVYFALQDEGVREAAKHAIKLALGGEKIGGLFAVFWFPPCYFFTQVIHLWLVKSFRSDAALMIVTTLVGVAAMNQLLDKFWLPLAFNVVAASLPIYHAGYIYRRLRLHLHRTPWFLIACGLISAVYMTAMEFHRAPPIFMKLAYYGWPVITLLAAIMFVIIAMQAVRHLVAIPLLSTLLVMIGRASLIIMYLHQAVQMTLLAIGIDGIVIRIVMGVGLSLLVSLIFALHPFTSRWFLGMNRDTERTVRA